MSNYYAKFLFVPTWRAFFYAYVSILLIAQWPHAMNASGPPGDVHHRLHRTRCWGVGERARALSNATSALAGTQRSVAAALTDESRGRSVHAVLSTLS